MAKVPTGERTAELLLLAQAAGPGGVDLAQVREAWGVSAPTMRRVVRQLLATVDRLGLDHLGTLRRGHIDDDPHRAGRPRRPTLIWDPGTVGASPKVKRVRAEDVVRPPEPEPPQAPHPTGGSLAKAFMGEIARRPFDLAARPDASDEGRLYDDAFKQLEQGVGEGDLERLADLRRRGFWFQPAIRRHGLQEGVLDTVITAVLHRRPLEIQEYGSPSSGRPPHPLVIEPWTLVQSYDGFYILGRDERDRRGPWALHRMKGVRRLREQSFEIPDDYDPADHLGHGFGPFLGQEGRTVLFVSDREWPWLSEMEIPLETGRRQVEGGWELELATGFTFGLHRWCLWQGVRILESEGMPDAEAAEHAARA